jgi:hypothetical protein
MIAGAGSIDDMDLLRHGAMPELFGGVRAPSTLGSHLRSYIAPVIAAIRLRGGNAGSVRGHITLQRQADLKPQTFAR